MLNQMPEVRITHAIRKPTNLQAPIPLSLELAPIGQPSNITNEGEYMNKSNPIT